MAYFGGIMKDVENPNFGKVLETDFIVFTNRSRKKLKMPTSDLFVFTAQELRQFTKQVEKKQKYWQRFNAKRKKKGLPLFHDFYIHLTPELSFLVPVKNVRIKK